MYEGERLDDMVESIWEHRVLNLVIVRQAVRSIRGYDKW